MSRILRTALVIVCIFSLAGCAELKQLRRETKDQKTRIDQMSRENQICESALKKHQDELLKRESELGGLKAELKEKDALLSKKDTQLSDKDAELKKKAADLKAKEAELKQKEATAREQSESFTKMQAAMKAELQTKQVALKELEGKLTLTMVESILFDSGQTKVKDEGVEALAKVAQVLKSVQDQDIIVAGYTDNVQIAGKLAKTYPSNWELSAARAISVVRILISDGVDPRLLCASGFSEYRPVADNETPEGRAKNRRMEIILMPKRK